ncbi:MAG: hypothetical protein MK209_01075 [Planctomycetes bacterium]|nr:hypothetical protein [Planctomycetota bacterium]
MRLHTFFALLALTALLTSSLLHAQRGAPDEAAARTAKLVVVVDGDPRDWANWGFLWDSAERRNGRIWRPVTGILDPQASRSQLAESNKRIVLGVTDQAWDPAEGPSEMEILATIQQRGWRLLQIDPRVEHDSLPHDLSVDRTTTYWFVR